MALSFVLLISTQPLCHSPWWCMLVHFHTNQFEMILHHTLSLALCILYFFPVLQKVKLGRVLLCLLGCTEAHYIVQAGLKLTESRGLRHHPGLVLLGRKHIIWLYLCNQNAYSSDKYVAKATPISSLSDVLLPSFGQNSVKRKHVSDIKKNIDKNSCQ